MLVLLVNTGFMPSDQALSLCMKHGMRDLYCYDVFRGFVFDFVTCPCCSKTKRHDNLFVYDDDDDDDNNNNNNGLCIVQTSEMCTK